MPNDEIHSDLSPVAVKFKEWRKAAGLVQVEAASQIGVRQNALSKWERGIVEKMTVDSIVGIARVYRQPVEEVVALVTGSQSLAAERQKRHAAFRTARSTLHAKARRASEKEFYSMLAETIESYQSYLEIAIPESEGRNDVLVSGVAGLRHEAEQLRAAAPESAKKRDAR